MMAKTAKIVNFLSVWSEPSDHQVQLKIILSVKMHLGMSLKKMQCHLKVFIPKEPLLYYLVLVFALTRWERCYFPMERPRELKPFSIYSRIIETLTGTHGFWEMVWRSIVDCFGKWRKIIIKCPLSALAHLLMSKFPLQIQLILFFMSLLRVFSILVSSGLLL